MHPAPSVIVFTTLSGAGFGFLFLLNLGLAGGTGLGALVAYAVGGALAVAGLLASTFHLGNPGRAWRAFSQWRTSWLSREAWFSSATLILSAFAALERMGGGGPDLVGLAGAALAAATVLATAMIYAQLRTVPRWNHWTTPLTYAAFALTGGAILSGWGWAAGLACLVLAAAMLLAWRLGDDRFATAGSTPNAATGLPGEVRPFAAHTAQSYVTKEMIHQVGRKHARKLRLIAIVLACLLPAALLFALPAGPVAALPAFACHLAGAMVQRWLFFAEAEHVVGHYYGRAPG
ncbi:dimethyl sulfoxide reductase anchor subunit [Frigidibacter sp. RF13]|uniref:dimethyl sulfoxide reductase anchor subunit family protein n=1 Tax=Frigidibacter sp. RF13 TaxID=2997340 RepID=UPI00226EF9A9|nr:DmsC/YnfH family molybdoenzyme membrane anchor subunit [Frigidibacter sp. RF13]MCY1125464.1 dimethyl sulfoxide reductase anchor subunit [Frigidibacter sp. RF13]